MQGRARIGLKRINFFLLEICPPEARLSTAKTKNHVAPQGRHWDQLRSVTGEDWVIVACGHLQAR